MKKTLIVIFCALILSPMAMARRREYLANENKAGLYAKSIEQVIRLREDEVDLATAALIVSEQWSDLVYGRRYISRLDDMALEIRKRLRQKKLNVDFRAIPVISEYLFEELGFKALSEANDPNDLFLHTVLDKKRGYCLSLSILYLSLAERLGLPIYGVVVPEHFFVRYDDRRVRLNIETTGKGGFATDEDYIKKFKVPEGQDSIYMKNLSKIQTLGCFLNNLGNSYMEIGDTESALQALLRAVEINPTLSECRANLGNIYLEKGRVADAIFEYRAALEINPDDPKTHNNLGNAYAQQNWVKYAISEYNQSLQLDPNFPDAYKNLAIAYCKQKSFAQAIAPLKQAILLEPKNAGCYNQLGNIYNELGRYKEAISQYKKALSIDRNLVEANYGLALCYNELGQVDNEIAEYTKVLAVKPDMLAALVNLGNAYFEKEKYDAAIEQYQKAARIDPNEAMIHYNLGAAYSNSKNYEQAVAEYMRAVELEPEMGDAHHGLAIGFYQLKKYDLAWIHIKIAERLGVEIPKDQLDAIKSKSQ